VNTFLDPSGNHVIVCLSCLENYYLHLKTNKIKKLSRLNGSIESVAFDRHATVESSARPFLIGTDSGNIYEIALDASGKERVFQCLYRLDLSIAITSLFYDVITSSSPLAATSTRIVVLAVTSAPTRLYTFLGGPTFSQLFEHYRLSEESSLSELPGELPRAELTTYHPTPEAPAQRFAVMTQFGIYQGQLQLQRSIARRV